MTKPSQISSEFIVMSGDFQADIVPVTNDLYEKLDRKYADFKGRSLTASHRFETDWPTWEMLFITPGEGTENREEPLRIDGRGGD